MKIHYNQTGAHRKKLVEAISTVTGKPASYLGAPGFAYQVGDITIDRDGTVNFGKRPSQLILNRLSELGYTAENAQETEQNPGSETPGLCISFPLADFTPQTLGNLKALLVAKGPLIKAALGIDHLAVTEEDDRLSFPWFKTAPDPEMARAATQFLSALVALAKTQKRVNATEKEVDNQKYAFRCFLLRLGFIGSEYKATRKVLLKNLAGSSAFKAGSKKGDTKDG